jgi:hypothetical protein
MMTVQVFCRGKDRVPLMAASPFSARYSGTPVCNANAWSTPPIWPFSD